MDLIEHRFQVEYRHRVFFTRGAFDPANGLLRQVLMEGAGRWHRALVTIDGGLAQAQPQLATLIEQYVGCMAPDLHLVCPPVLLEGGEPVKNSLRPVARIQALIERHGLCRHSYVIAVGGGAHLDAVGFATATAHRGVRHVRLPTTTLAQADSGVGVKNGINAFGKKNFIGTFVPPVAVINDFDLLTSLPPRDRRAGYAEAVKVALIRDADFFERLENLASRLADFEPLALQEVIRRTAALHLQHIATSGDPFEFGSARPLDFGHWAAHKLEQLTGYALRHGEAVAIGIALDTVYARLVGMLDPTSVERVLALLERLGFALFAEALQAEDASGNRLVLAGLNEFREHLGGEMTITLLAALGRGVEVHTVDPAVVLEAIEELARRRHAPARASMAGPD